MNDTQQVTMTLEEAEGKVKLNTHLQNLLNNEDFKALFMEYIFKDDVIRMHKLLGDPSVRANPPLLEKINKELEAVALLDNSLRVIQQEGVGSAQLIEDYKQAEAEGVFDPEEDADEE
ncbi:endonuclease [Alteromonas phage vB_AemP_PT15-A5]|nr:endonuclease [Alteromonas phage vB_AemP_PT15-A5]